MNMASDTVAPSLNRRLSIAAVTTTLSEWRFATRPADISLKLAVNNLFNEEYESVLNRPMPGRNFEFFIEIRPNFRKTLLRRGE